MISTNLKEFKMSPKVLISFVLIFVLSVGVYFVFFNTPKEVSTVDQSAATEILNNNSSDIVNVVYTNAGFSPKEISVKKGQKVRFTNLSDKRMWVASDEHPSHDIYPEFDQKSNTMKEGTYEFTFDKIGVWGYHNHSGASDIGKITVTQ